MKNNKIKVLTVCLAGVLHCILSLCMWVFISGELNIPTGPTFGILVYYASLVIWFPTTLLAVLHILPFTSLFFPLLLILNSIGLGFLLYRWMNREESIQQENNTARPRYLAVICWFFIITGAYSLVITSMNIYNNPAAQQAAESPILFFLLIAMVYATFIIKLVSGVAMLKGKNWARLLYVGWVVISFIIELAISSMRAEMIPNFMISLVIVFFLFRPQANRFFSQVE